MSSNTKIIDPKFLAWNQKEDLYRNNPAIWEEDILVRYMDGSTSREPIKNLYGIRWVQKIVSVLSRNAHACATPLWRSMLQNGKVKLLKPRVLTDEPMLEHMAVHKLGLVAKRNENGNEYAALMEIFGMDVLQLHQEAYRTITGELFAHLHEKTLELFNLSEVTIKSVDVLRMRSSPYLAMHSSGPENEVRFPIKPADLELQFRGYNLNKLPSRIFSMRSTLAFFGSREHTAWKKTIVTRFETQLPSPPVAPQPPLQPPLQQPTCQPPQPPQPPPQQPQQPQQPAPPVVLQPVVPPQPTQQEIREAKEREEYAKKYAAAAAAREQAAIRAREKAAAEADEVARARAQKRAEDAAKQAATATAAAEASRKRIAEQEAALQEAAVQEAQKKVTEREADTGVATQQSKRAKVDSPEAIESPASPPMPSLYKRVEAAASSSSSEAKIVINTCDELSYHFKNAKAVAKSRIGNAMSFLYKDANADGDGIHIWVDKRKGGKTEGALDAYASIDKTSALGRRLGGRGAGTFRLRSVPDIKKVFQSA